MDNTRIGVPISRDEFKTFNDNIFNLYYDTRPDHKQCVLRYNLLCLVNEIWQSYLIEKEQNAIINKSNPKYASFVTDDTWIETKTIETIKNKPYKKYIKDSSGATQTIWCTPIEGAKEVLVLREYENGPIMREIHIPSVMIFGSIAFGLDGIGSDIDIALPAGIYNQAVNAHLDTSRQVKLLREFEKRLRLYSSKSRKRGFNWKIEPILHARVPIIKLSDKKHGLSVDIGIRSTQMPITRLISFYCSYDERVRLVYMFIKRWSKRRRISDAMNGFPNSFGFIMLVTKFLQILPEPVIPIMDWDRNKKKMMEKHSIRRFKPNTMSLVELAVSFFDYFCHLDYDSYQISITSAGLQWKHVQDYNLNHPDQGTVLIEDPMSKNQNVTRSLKPDNLKVLKQEFFRGYKCAKNGDWDLLFDKWTREDDTTIFDYYPPMDKGERQIQKEFESYVLYNDDEEDWVEDEDNYGLKEYNIGPAGYKKKKNKANKGGKKSKYIIKKKSKQKS
eukprot:274001_1